MYGNILTISDKGTLKAKYTYDEIGNHLSYIDGLNFTWKTDGTNTIHYTYDADGKLVYMNLNGTLYYYERNAQNDIVELIDTNMNEVVTYSYDTWGKLLNIGGSLASTVGTINSFRYPTLKCLDIIMILKQVFTICRADIMMRIREGL